MLQFLSTETTAMYINQQLSTTARRVERFHYPPEGVVLAPELLQPGLVLVGDVDEPEQRILQLAVPAVTRLVAGLDGRVSHV